MEKLDIKIFLDDNAIEEKIPYFGKARLLTIPLSYFLNNESYIIPKEIFHFITALYIIDNNPNHQYTFHINSYKKDIDNSLFSTISTCTNNRINILKDPVLIGMNTIISLKLLNNKNIIENEVVNLLIEYAKIPPELYHDLHSNQIVLVSKQDNNIEISQFRGNAP